MIRTGCTYKEAFKHLNMSTLIYEHLAPITFRIGFLNHPFEGASAFFVSWIRQHFKSIESVELSLPIEGALLQLQPLAAIPRRWLFVQAANGWVAYFDNCVRGPDPASTIGYMTEQLGCRGVIATSIPHNPPGNTGINRGIYGAVQFELFSPHKMEFLNYERTVSVAYDTKWRFDANGAVQSFEDLAKYQNRRIVDRFTTEMLKNYCHALGIRVDSSDFYQNRAILVSSNDPLPDGHLQFSLTEVQQQMGRLGQRTDAAARARL